MKSKDPLDFQLTINKKQFILKLVIDCHMRYVILTVILMLTAGIAGYTVGNLKPILKNITPQLNQNQTRVTKTNPMFQSQSATVTGKIVSVNGSNITVTDAKNQTDQFPLSKRLIIFKLSAEGGISSPSADLKSIEVNKDATLNLELNNNHFEVVAIRYFSPVSAKTPPIPLTPRVVK